MTALHAIGNWLSHFFGIGGSGSYHGFWSGAGIDIARCMVAGAILLLLRFHIGSWRFFSKRPRVTAEKLAEAYEEAQATHLFSRRQSSRARPHPRIGGVTLLALSSTTFEEAGAMTVTEDTTERPVQRSTIQPMRRTWWVFVGFSPHPPPFVS